MRGGRKGGGWEGVGFCGGGEGGFFVGGGGREGGVLMRRGWGVVVSRPRTESTPVYE